MSAKNDELPDSWLACSLGDVVDYGKTEKAEPNEISNDAWVLELEDIEKDTSQLLARLTFAERKSKSTKNRFDAGDVLYGKLRPYLNKVLIADQPGVCTTEIIPLRKSGNLDNRYLFYWLKHPSFLAYVSAVSHGLNMPRLGTEAGRQAPFVLAPLAEQKRIADTLEMLLGRVNACRAKLDFVPALLKRFRQSVLAAAASGELTAEWRLTNTGKQGMRPAPKDLCDDQIESPFPFIPADWDLRRSADVVEEGTHIIYGIIQPGAKLAEGVPYVRGTDIQDGKILIHQLLKTSPTIAGRYSRSELKGGDILLGIIRATKVALVPDELKGANITQGTARFRPSAILRSRFLACVLESPSVQKWLHAHYRGIDMPGLNLADVRRIPIPIPSLDEQDEIIRRVEKLLTFSGLAEFRFFEVRKMVECLTPATLVKAFRGELVPQDPNDKTASELLQSIMTSAKARSTSAAKKRGADKKLSNKPKSMDDLKGKILGMADTAFTFDELRDSVSTSYEQIRETVFELLAESPPRLHQEFDKNSECMKFRVHKS